MRHWGVCMKVRGICQGLHFSTLVALFCASAAQAWCAPAATTTTLAITAGGNAVTTVPSESMVTLTATVVAGTTPVTVGQVNFCDAAAKYCTDIHIVGTAQLIQTGPTAGTAVYRFIPGIGSHSYKAVFAGTPNAATAYAGSTSASMALAVTGKPLTASVITATGSAGNYTLAATVGGTGSIAPTGTITFIDTANNNAVLGTAKLSAAPAGLSFLNASNPVLPVSQYSQDSLVAGDFNGDGIPDLSYSFGPMLLGNGDGTFTAKPTIGGEFAIVAGDFNGDGKLDLAGMVEYFLFNGTVVNDSAVTSFLGNGDGSFTAGPPLVLPGQNTFFDAAVADFNGDGVLDLAVTNNAENLVTVLLGNGDGTFTAGANLTVVGPGVIGVGDFNGDGKPDMAVTSLNNTANTVSVLLGNGDGTFTAAGTPISTGSSYISPVGNLIAVADFNGDGIPDLAVTNNADNTVTVLLGKGDGTFAASPSSSPAGLGPGPIVVGDFNGDGIADLAIMDIAEPYPYGPHAVTVLLGDGTGKFTPGATVTTGDGAYFSVAADFNGDGNSDLAVADSGPHGNFPTAMVLLAENQAATAPAIGVTLPIGTYRVVASYPGDANYNASTSGAVVLANTLNPTVTVSLSSSNITAAQGLTVTIMVSGVTGNPTPTGTVTVASGTSTSDYTSAPGVLSGGSTTITVPAGALPAATNALLVTYGGDSDYSSASATVPITVAGFVINYAALTFAAGATTGNTANVDVTPTGGFTGSVTLTAKITAQPNAAVGLPTLSFGATSPVSITGTAGGTATLTISTTAPSPCPAATRMERRVGSWAGSGALLACVFLFLLPARRRRWQSILGSLLLLLAICNGVLACGGGSKVAPCTAVAGTTPGDYTITVTGTSGAITETGPISFTVK
jgi:trimeric autotransporter adhesin